MHSSASIRRSSAAPTWSAYSNPAALLRLAGSVLVEAHDEWHVADKHYLSEATLALLNKDDKPTETIAAAAALTA
jgi:putative transposase